MASIDYPFPDPKNKAEGEANRQAADDYQRLEERRRLQRLGGGTGLALSRRS